MPDDFTEKLHEITLDQSYDPKQLIFVPQESKEKVYILKRGEVQIYRYANDKKVVVNRLAPGDVFGDILDDDDPSRIANFAESVGNTYVCVASKNDFLKILHAYPQVALRLIKQLGSQLQEAEDRIRDFGMNKVSVRLLNEIIRQAKKIGTYDDDYYWLENKVTHQQLAQSINASRETITKTVQELKEKGFIKIEKNMIKIDRQTLPDVL